MMEHIDKLDWEAFRNNKLANRISKDELELISKLHAKYMKHKYQYVGGCNCKGTIKKVQNWIDDINKIYKNEH